jgi:hypothetical protein
LYFATSVVLCFNYCGEVSYRCAISCCNSEIHGQCSRSPLVHSVTRLITIHIDAALVTGYVNARLLHLVHLCTCLYQPTSGHFLIYYSQNKDLLMALRCLENSLTH